MYAMTEQSEHPNTERPNAERVERPSTGEPRLAAFVSWLVLGSSFGLSASTWIAIARLAGYTEHVDLFGWTAAIAWLMPIAFDGYVVVALVLWTAPVPEPIARFARKNTYGAASVGVIAQSAYHCATAAAATGSWWQAAMAAGAGMIPPGVAALAVHMRALIRRESGRSIARPNTLAPIARQAGPIAAEAVRPIAQTERQPITSTPNAERPNTLEPNTPNTEQPNTPAPIAPNTERANTLEPIAGRPNASSDERPNTTDRQNVRSLDSARHQPNTDTSGDVAANMQEIKNHFRDWRTNMPAARAIARHLGVSPSTGQAYRVRLAAELADKRERVAVS